MNHSYCPSLSPQVLQFSRSASRESHSDWAEICRDRGWTALDKDYPQLLPVKGCCGGGDLRRGHRCGWWHPDKYWGQEPSLITREHHQHQSLHTIKLYWKHPLEYVLCLQGAASIYIYWTSSNIKCTIHFREAVCVVPQSKTLAKLSIVMEICYQEIMDFSPNQRALKVELVRAARRIW